MRPPKATRNKVLVLKLRRKKVTERKQHVVAFSFPHLYNSYENNKYHFYRENGISSLGIFSAMKFFTIPFFFFFSVELWF